MKDLYWVIICIACVAATFTGAWFIAVNTMNPGGPAGMPSAGPIPGPRVTPGDYHPPDTGAAAAGTSRSTPAPAQTVMPAPTSNPDLVISGDHIATEEDGSMFVVGNITNAGTTTYRNLSVHIDLYDANGSRLSRLSYVTGNIAFLPGETRDFEAIFLDEGATSYNISSAYAS